MAASDTTWAHTYSSGDICGDWWRSSCGSGDGGHRAAPGATIVTGDDSGESGASEIVAPGGEAQHFVALTIRHIDILIHDMIFEYLTLREFCRLPRPRRPQGLADAPGHDVPLPMIMRDHLARFTCHLSWP